MGFAFNDDGSRLLIGMETSPSYVPLPASSSLSQYERTKVVFCNSLDYKKIHFVYGDGIGPIYGAAQNPPTVYDAKTIPVLSLTYNLTSSSRNIAGYVYLAKGQSIETRVEISYNNDTHEYTFYTPGTSASGTSGYKINIFFEH